MNKSAPLEIRKVVERNDLLESLSKLDATPIKLFELAVSCINVDSPPNNNVVYLQKKDIFNLFEAKSSNDSYRMKRSIKDLQKQVISIIKEVSPGKYEEVSIVPIPTASWTSYNDIVKIKFNEDLMPYLIDLKSNFTQYSIVELKGLKSRYSLILYKYLVGINNQYESYKYTNKRTKNQLEELKNPYIDMTELRKLTDTIYEYKRFDSFEARVLKKAKEEISAYTHLDIDYEKIKDGRRYRGIRFYVNRKNIAKIPESVVNRSMSLTEEEESTLFTRAATSQYTNLLTKSYLLNIEDITNKELMINLIPVYKKYAELEDLRGIDGVKNHLNYVFDKQNKTDKTNIVKYLEKSIVSYLQKVKIENIS